MKREKTYLSILLLTSSMLRLWKLNEIPKGLSLEEVRFGLVLSNFLGDWFLKPVYIRFIFVILGVASIFLLYKFLRNLGKDFWFSYISSALLAVTPWHISQSRIYSVGMIYLFALLIAGIVFSKSIKKFTYKISKTLFIFSFFLFLISVFRISADVKHRVDLQRNIASKTQLGSMSRLFSNKLIESYRIREKIIFENLDIGNYFFKGHPRERWGVEENKKFYIIFLPLFLLGTLKIKKKLGFLLLAWSAVAISLAAFMNSGDSSVTLALIVLVVVCVTSALSYLRDKGRKSLLYLVSGFFIFEFLIFGYSYFNGLNESMFSPRRPIYDNLAEEVTRHLRSEDRVLVSLRLGNPAEYFNFYLEDNLMTGIDFRVFNIWKEENKDGLFVDVLPDNPSPNEPLYTETGLWPSEIEPLAEFYDNGLLQKVIIYRYQ